MARTQTVRTDETRDFNIYGDYEDEPAENVNRRKRSETFWKIWKIVRVPFIIAASLFITYMLLSTVGKKIYNKYLMPVDPNDSTPIIVTIPQGQRCIHGCKDSLRGRRRGFTRFDSAQSRFQDLR